MPFYPSLFLLRREALLQGLSRRELGRHQLRRLLKFQRDGLSERKSVCPGYYETHFVPEFTSMDKINRTKEQISCSNGTFMVSIFKCFADPSITGGTCECPCHDDPTSSGYTLVGEKHYKHPSTAGDFDSAKSGCEKLASVATVEDYTNVADYISMANFHSECFHAMNLNVHIREHCWWRFLGGHPQSGRC